MVAVRLLAHDNQFADGDQLLTPLGQRRREIVAHRYLNGGWWYAVQTGYGRKWYSEAVLVECNPGNILVFESVDKTMSENAPEAVKIDLNVASNPDVAIPPEMPPGRATSPDVELPQKSPFIDGYWIPVSDGDRRALALFKRHYSYREYRDKRERTLFVGPGEKMVLMTFNCDALFIWRKFISGDGQHGINCSLFRNESSIQSSVLIQEAVQLAWQRWPDARLYTYVNPTAIKSTNPGYCFKIAGWKKCGITKVNKLHILELLPPLTPSDLWEFDASAPETPVCGEAGLPVKAQPLSPDYLKLDGVLKNAANGAGYANRRDQVQAALDMLMTEWGRLRVVDDRWRAFERAEIELTQALVFAAHPSRANGLAACAACSRAAFELRSVGK